MSRASLKSMAALPLRWAQEDCYGRPALALSGALAMAGAREKIAMTLINTVRMSNLTSIGPCSLGAPRRRPNRLFARTVPELKHLVGKQSVT